MPTKKKASKKKDIVKVDAKLSKKVSDFILLKSNITKATKQVTDMKSEAAKMEAELIPMLIESQQLGMMVTVGKVALKEKDVFSATNWQHIEAHVKKTGDFGLYQKRLSTTLLKEYWDDGVKIKGIEHMMKTTLAHSVRKE